MPSSPVRQDLEFATLSVFATPRAGGEPDQPDPAPIQPGEPGEPTIPDQPPPAPMAEAA
ncbi:hypothetical protein [Pseudomonas oryzihabitans]|uniref:hypothetical protein n=1 Tax=Pseudomonas oryzihabitans TaxID=47885 RepID=UPI00289457E9|nr:hypothetical protein [Pseudomonas oryzihabitans]MDT3720745.1 hypothetical protein [Pseudomonas oryzihabitans]